MNIAWVAPGGVDRSGTHRVIPAMLALLSRLAARHRVTVYALQQEATAGEWTLAGARIVNLGARATRLDAIRRLRTDHRAMPFDVVHGHKGGRSAFIAALAVVGTRVPCIQYLGGGELVALPSFAFGGRLGWRARLQSFIAMRAARTIICESQCLAAQAAALGLAARVVPLGVDRRVWPALAPRPRATSRPPRLLHVGSLNRIKDQRLLPDALLEVLRAYPDATLDVVGEDTLRGTVAARAAALGIGERITFHGFLTQDALRPLVHQADLHLVCSRHEGGCTAILEAAMCGVPTVATAVGHARTLAPHAAVTVPLGDARALGREVVALLGDDARRLRIAGAAQAWALAHDADAGAAEVERIYAAAIAR